MRIRENILNVRIAIAQRVQMALPRPIIEATTNVTNGKNRLVKQGKRFLARKYIPEANEIINNTNSSLQTITSREARAKINQTREPRVFKNYLQRIKDLLIIETKLNELRRDGNNKKGIFSAKHLLEIAEQNETLDKEEGRNYFYLCTIPVGEESKHNKEDITSSNVTTEKERGIAELIRNALAGRDLSLSLGQSTLNSEIENIGGFRITLQESQVCGNITDGNPEYPRSFNAFVHER